jgi:hypothetical protein
MCDNADQIRMGDGMRVLKVAVIVMGVLIIAGTLGLVVEVMRRVAGQGGSMTTVQAILDEPVGTRIAGIAAVQDRVAVRLQGGGTDRVVLVDPRTGGLVGRISLAR